MNGVASVLFSGFAIGFVGSVHCVGMCGPLALALPVDNEKVTSRVAAIFFYNIGRSITYGILGLIFGLLGMTFFLFNVQQWLSIISGVIMLLLVLNYKFTFFKNQSTSPIIKMVQDKLTTLLMSRKSVFQFFMFGIFNGLLPCGLVYMALLLAVATADIYDSSILMIGFGLGTVPLMAGVMLMKKMIPQKARITINKVSPYMFGLVAILLILRGLNLGLPYVSPKIGQKGEVMCHQK